MHGICTTYLTKIQNILRRRWPHEFYGASKLIRWPEDEMNVCLGKPSLPGDYEEEEDRIPMTETTLTLNAPMLPTRYYFVHPCPT